MKYNKIIVYGHRRTGTHYITALISRNFFDRDNYIKIYGKHKTPDLIDYRKNIGYIIVKRNMEDTIKSIFNMRNRFGMKAKTLEEFKSKRYSEMWNSKAKVSVLVNTIVKKKKNK